MELTAPKPKEIVFRADVRPEVHVIAALYEAASLDRPIQDLDRIRRMYEGANLVLTAWLEDSLVGILRGWSDGGFVGYIADLAVHADHQRRGIGRHLLEMAIETNREVQFVLRAAPAAQDYYEHIGWRKLDDAWYWPRER